MEHQPIKTWEEEDRPREKLLKLGKHSLSNSELIAIILRTGTDRETAVDLARNLIAYAKNDLDQLSKMSVAEISKIKGIGIAKAITLIAAIELGNRKANLISNEISKITSSQDAFAIMNIILSDLRHEEFWLVLLDRANNVITKIQLSKGGVAGTVVDPKLVFKVAIDHLASGIILNHNHPSGNLKPSESDIKLTSRLKNAGQLLDIVVLDHLIISKGAYFSFSDDGIM